MANINKIKLSGTTYNIQDENATKTVELTQAQYDALTVKDPNTFYIITDSQGVDLSNYYTRLETDDLLDTKLDVSAYTPTDLSNYYKKSETSGATQISTALASKANKSEIPSLDGYATETWVEDKGYLTEHQSLSNYYTKSETSGATEISTALASKQTTLTAGTNITIVDNVISAEGGGSITIDPSLDSGSTNPVANSAITTAINAVSGAIPSTYVSSISRDSVQGWQRFVRFSTPSSFNYFILDNPKINGTPIHKFTGVESNIHNFSLVETSAITTSITSSSTDAQVPSAKAVNDQLGGLKLVKLSQSEYDALATKDNSTLYVIVN